MQTSSIQAITEAVQRAATWVEPLQREIAHTIVGQRALVDRLLIALIGNGHVLLEGVPGLAKTLTVKTLARTVRGTFKRIQFTPDLVPADLVGTRIYNQKTGEFGTTLGPVFANLLVDGRPLAARSGFGRLVWLSLVSGMVMTAWDLSVDPLLSGPDMRAWVWHDGGPYFGVPVHNYAGWLLTTFTIYLLFRLYERRVAPRPLAALTVATACMPLVAYAVMGVTDMFRANQALLVITPFTMGLPVLLAAGRLLELRPARRG